MAENRGKYLDSVPRSASLSDDPESCLDTRNNRSVKNKQKRDDSIYLDSRSLSDLPDDRACQSAPANKAGWLDKAPPQGVPFFQKRWVRVDSEYLKYFESEKDVYTKKMIPLNAMDGVHPVGSRKFEVVTQNRTFVFRAQSESERDEWVSLLQDMTQGKCNNKNGTPGYGSSAHMQGYLDLRGVHGKLFVAAYEENIILYRDAEDFKWGIGISSVPMNLGCVKEVDRTAFDLTTPYRVFSFVAESEEVKQTWMEAFQFSIRSSLSSDAVIGKVWSLEPNRFCADCGAARPEWASVNLLVVICSLCAGEHRRLGSCVSKVKSLKMDRNVWTDELIQVFVLLGNARANLFWAMNVPESEALCPTSSDQKRRKFIFAKYWQRKYCCYHQLSGQQEELNRALCSNVKTNDILETLSLVFCGADVNCDTGEAEFPSTIALAMSHNQPLQAEILNQNQNTDIPKMDLEESVDTTLNSAVSITHSGDLHKTPSTTRLITEHKPKEEFSLCSCLLRNGHLILGSSRKSLPSNQLKVDEIVCMSIKPPGTHGYKHTFEIYSESEHLCLFGDDDPDTVGEWIKSILKSFLPSNAQYLGDLEFQRIGRLKYRVGLTQHNYNMGWFALVGSILHGHLPGFSRKEEIDLYKLQDLCVQQDQNRLVLVENGRTWFLESEWKLDLQGWISDIQQAAGTGGDTLAQQLLTKENTPIIVERIIAYITRFGLMSEGIYRRNGVHSRIGNLLKSFQQDARKSHLREGEHHIDDVTGALKRFFRNLNEGLFTNQAAASWLDTTAIQDEKGRIARYQSLLSDLPPVNKATLRLLISHLYCVQKFANKNYMDQHNLAIVFGPTLFQTDGTSNHPSQVIEDLIQHYAKVFSVNEQQLEKERNEIKFIMKMQDSLEIETKPEPLEEIISTVYLEDNGQRMEQHIKVCTSMDAAAVTSEVLDQCRIKPQERDYWSTYEVNHAEETERPLHHLEKVFPVLFSDSTLVVKRNSAMETMLIYLASKVSMSKYGNVKMRGDRSFLGFQNRYVSLTTTALRIYKEANRNQPEKEWPVKSLTVHQGVKKKLNPPTRWGLTLVHKDDKQERRKWYMCCETEVAMSEWIAVIMGIQHEGSLWPTEKD